MGTVILIMAILCVITIAFAFAYTADNNMKRADLWFLLFKIAGILFILSVAIQILITI